MNLNKFLFKLFVTITYIFKVGLVVLPLSIIIVIGKEGGWRYGFTFIQNNYGVALFIAFAIGFLVALYHAVSYEIVGEGPLSNYLKSRQIANVEGGISLDELKEKLETNTKYKSVKLEGEILIARRKVHFVKPDFVSVKKVSAGIYELKSKPFTRLWFLDFGRNFKNIKELGKLLK